MPFVLSEVTSPSSFPPIFDCEHTAYSNPFTGFTFLFENRIPDPIASRAENIERQWATHASNPASHWIQVIDEGTGAVAGAANWTTYETDPFEKPEARQEPEPTWWPEGEGREFVKMIIGQVVRPRAKIMRRPCCILEICFVHPAYRRRGVGSMLMNWGVTRADEMGVEAFIEATDDGRLLYERYGFRFMYQMVLSSTVEHPSETWRELERELRTPMTGHFMWRPPGGKFVDGETVVPWEI